VSHPRSDEMGAKAVDDGGEVSDGRQGGGRGEAPKSGLTDACAELRLSSVLLHTLKRAGGPIP